KPKGVGAFTIDAVAKRAGVAPMTVYHHFGSKDGLLQAMFDELSIRGGMHEVPRILANTDPLAALDGYISAFGQFWNSDPVVIGRILAMSALDESISTRV